MGLCISRLYGAVAKTSVHGRTAIGGIGLARIAHGGRFASFLIGWSCLISHVVLGCIAVTTIIGAMVACLWISGRRVVVGTIPSVGILTFVTSVFCGSFSVSWCIFGKAFVSIHIRRRRIVAFLSTWMMIAIASVIVCSFIVAVFSCITRLLEITFFFRPVIKSYFLCNGDPSTHAGQSLSRCLFLLLFFVKVGFIKIIHSSFTVF